MHYVYILQSTKIPSHYVGQTNNLLRRLDEHNSGKSFHTKSYSPWEVVWYSAFAKKEDALLFEKYLKTGSGIAFMKKRLIRQ